MFIFELRYIHYRKVSREIDSNHILGMRQEVPWFR